MEAIEAAEVAMFAWAEWWRMYRSPPRDVRRTTLNAILFWEPTKGVKRPVVIRVGTSDPTLARILSEERLKISFASTVNLMLLDFDMKLRYPMCAEALGQTQSQIASTLGIKQPAVSKRISAAKESLGKRLLGDPVAVRKYL